MTLKHQTPFSSHGMHATCYEWIIFWCRAVGVSQNWKKMNMKMMMTTANGIIVISSASFPGYKKRLLASILLSQLAHLDLLAWRWCLFAPLDLRWDQHEDPEREHCHHRRRHRESTSLIHPSILTSIRNGVFSHASLGPVTTRRRQMIRPLLNCFSLHNRINQLNYINLAYLA